jgi:predicted phosphodiesterase
MNRRSFIKNSGLAGIGVSTAAASVGAALPLSAASADKVAPVSPANENFERIRIGICADLHQDIMHDGPRRLDAFIRDMETQRPDFIIQMGDFCTPIPRNQVIVDTWERFPGPKYHVLGNHDTDGGFKREDAVAFWKAAGKYYSFDVKGYHFIVLDGNEHNPASDRAPGYARYIGDEQLQWLEGELDKTTKPVVIFCHQGLDYDIGGIEKAIRVRGVLERANTKAGDRKVQMVFSGHHHLDFHNVINGIHYVQINSMSYFWLGERYQSVRYGEAVDKAHPAIKNTVPYKDALWAVIDILPNGNFSLKGQRSVFVGIPPAELGPSLDDLVYPIVPFISNRDIHLTMKPFDYAGS